jgi:hypothetical protein
MRVAETRSSDRPERHVSERRCICAADHSYQPFSCHDHPQRGVNFAGKEPSGGPGPTSVALPSPPCPLPNVRKRGGDIKDT